jgi:hypothetical protein
LPCAIAFASIRLALRLDYYVYVVTHVISLFNQWTGYPAHNQTEWSTAYAATILDVVKNLRRVLIIVIGVSTFGAALWQFIGAAFIDRSSYGQPFEVISSALLFSAGTLILAALKQKSSIVGLVILGFICLFPFFGSLQALSEGHFHYSVVIMLSIPAFLMLGIVSSIIEQDWNKETGKRLAIHLSIPIFVIFIGFLSAVDSGPWKYTTIALSQRRQAAPTHADVGFK